MNQDSSPVVVVNQLMFGYATPMFPPVTFSIAQGEIVGIIGHNGSGKSTLLKTLCGIIPALGGDAVVPNNKIGYIPQCNEINMLVPLTALEVVALNLVPSLGYRKLLRKSHYDQAQKALERYGIGALRNTLFREMSGGQRQRVLLARALVMNPTLLLCDEPTTGLDPQTKKQLFEEFCFISKEQGITIIFTTHQVQEVHDIATTLISMDHENVLFEITQSEVNQ